MPLIEVDNVKKLPEKFYLFPDVEWAQYMFPEDDIYVYKVTHGKRTYTIVAVEAL